MLYYGKKLVIFIISVGLLSLVTFYVSDLHREIHCFLTTENEWKR